MSSASRGRRCSATSLRALFEVPAGFMKVNHLYNHIKAAKK
jgi:hypothetical protein